jgi:hypothetical protein
MKKQYNENLVTGAVDPFAEILTTLKTLESQITQLQNASPNKEPAKPGLTTSAGTPIKDADGRQFNAGPGLTTAAGTPVVDADGRQYNANVKENTELTQWLKIAGLK